MSERQRISSGSPFEPKVGISRALRVGNRFSCPTAPTIARAHAPVFGDARPVSAMVVVSGFLDPRWKVEIEAEAILD